MSKVISVVTAIFMFVSGLVPFVAGRDGRAFGRETLVLEADSFPVGTERIEGVRYNGTFRPVGQGMGYLLDKWVDGAWLHIGPTFEMIPIGMYLLRPFARAEISCNLTWCDPPLEAGRYRVRVGRARAEFTLTGAVTLTPESQIYPVGTKSVSAILFNGTSETIQYAAYPNGIPLENWDGNQWVVIERDHPLMPTGGLLSDLAPMQSVKRTYSLFLYYDNLPTGRYRFDTEYGPFEFQLVGEVTLTPEFDTYPVGASEITATLYNGSLERFDYTVGYIIEKWDGEAWGYAGPNLFFITLMQYLLPGGGVTLTCELSYCDPPLEAGLYRIVVRDVYGEFTLI